MDYPESGLEFEYPNTAQIGGCSNSWSDGLMQDETHYPCWPAPSLSPIRPMSLSPSSTMLQSDWSSCSTISSVIGSPYRSPEDVSYLENPDCLAAPEYQPGYIDPTLISPTMSDRNFLSEFETRNLLSEYKSFTFEKTRDGSSPPFEEECRRQTSTPGLPWYLYGTSRSVFDSDNREPSRGSMPSYSSLRQVSIVSTSNPPYQKDRYAISEYEFEEPSQGPKYQRKHQNVAEPGAYLSFLRSIRTETEEQKIARQSQMKRNADLRRALSEIDLLMTNTALTVTPGKEKQRCPHLECGKVFKDLKAHMVLHQQERPEKCPIQTCDYHVKGFARKYDRNRHTLTHYKGTMVCGFCPGSGSAAEKSFNRADVFKRHLTAVHGVEQTHPNSRKKIYSRTNITGYDKLGRYPPDATGKCSTCSHHFLSAQDFYEHLDDCVLQIVDPTNGPTRSLTPGAFNGHNHRHILLRDMLSRSNNKFQFEVSSGNGPSEKSNRIDQTPSHEYMVSSFTWQRTWIRPTIYSWGYTPEQLTTTPDLSDGDVVRSQYLLELSVSVIQTFVQLLSHTRMLKTQQPVSDEIDYCRHSRCDDCVGFVC